MAINQRDFRDCCRWDYNGWVHFKLCNIENLLKFFITFIVLIFKKTK